MIRINLLPVREWRRKEAVRQQISIFFLSLVLLLALLLSAGITVQGKLQMERAELEDLKKQKQKLAYVDKKIAKLNKTRKQIEEKFSAIEKLQTGRTLTTRVLDELVSSIPIDRIWFNTLTFKDQELKVSGVALDNHTVALFMKRIEASPLFSSVTLLNTSRYNVKGQDLMQFSLRIKVNEKGINPNHAAAKFAKDARRKARRRTFVLQVPDNKADLVKLAAPCGFKCQTIFNFGDVHLFG